jgi:large subunit ribosomal protein L24
MTQPKFFARKGDTVQVITGKYKGHRGVIRKVFLKEGKVLVENVNVVARNAKPDYKHPEGTYKKELPIDISNVSLIDPSNNKPGKIGHKMDENGKKVRYFRKSGTVL